VLLKTGDVHRLDLHLHLVRCKTGNPLVSCLPYWWGLEIDIPRCHVTAASDALTLVATRRRQFRISNLWVPRRVVFSLPNVPFAIRSSGTPLPQFVHLQTRKPLNWNCITFFTATATPRIEPTILVQLRRDRSRPLISNICIELYPTAV
jgi:hypothetical protein